MLAEKKGMRHSNWLWATLRAEPPSKLIKSWLRLRASGIAQPAIQTRSRRVSKRSADNRGDRGGGAPSAGRDPATLVVESVTMTM